LTKDKKVVITNHETFCLGSVIQKTCFKL